MKTTLIYLITVASAVGAIAVAPAAQAGPAPVLCVMWNPCRPNAGSELVGWNGVAG
jgi:hypothetical protein